MRRRWARSQRLGLLSVVLVPLCFTLGAAAAHKLPCSLADYDDGRAYSRLCYSDLLVLYVTEGMADERLPYLEACPFRLTECDEYPPLTMYTMRFAAGQADSAQEFMRVNMVVLAAAAVATGVVLWRLVGRRALYFTLAPALALTGFLSWDLLAVGLCTAGLAAFLRGRDMTAGVFLGLAAAAKLYPAGFVLPLVLDRLDARQRRAAATVVLAAAGAWALTNVPFAVAAFSEWSNVYQFSADRPVAATSVWGMACSDGASWCRDTDVVNVLAALAAGAGMVVVWWLCRRTVNFRAWTLVLPLTAIVLVVTKFQSLQYSLWLLPLFALVPIGWKAVAAFFAVDASSVVISFLYAGTLYGHDGPSLTTLQTLRGLRAAVLVACIVVYVRQARSAPRAVAVRGEPNRDRMARDGVDGRGGDPVVPGTRLR